LNDLHDLTMLASQQEGFGGVANNDAARRAFTDYIQPLFAQQGRRVSLMEHPTIDKFRDDDTGEVVDFVGGAGGSNPRFTAQTEGAGGAGGAGGMGGGAAVPVDFSGGGSSMAKALGDPGFFQMLMAKLGGQVDPEQRSMIEGLLRG
jgi:hypothetical protein